MFGLCCPGISVPHTAVEQREPLVIYGFTDALSGIRTVFNTRVEQHWRVLEDLIWVVGEFFLVNMHIVTL